MKIDLNNLETIRITRSYIGQNHSDINAIINNAGISGDMSKSSSDFTVEELKEATDVNFFGYFEIIKSFTPILATNNGKILNLTINENPNSFFYPFT
ncbi:SDR family NAD(P)-dependent oxidoreductase [Weissella koreensis]|uniref:SDR family oxidoreductase n=1 Tax=Weissella koreensis TaxID=165096 RepID=A0A7H1MKK0_9LACO|nr:SDR family oxidoreductase [Weissella koreensis]QNT63986.1 SDR family oxidoreductase [Weissella koreensis]